MKGFEQDVMSKLDRLTAIALGVPHVAPVTPGPAGVVTAFDRPSLTVLQVNVFDGVTIQKDGSVWGLTSGSFSPTPDVAAPDGTPYQLSFGYISPVKTPDIWTVGAKWSSNWAAMDAAWRANPYALYKADIQAWIKSNGGVNGPNNFALLGYMLNSYGSFVQD